MQSTSASEFQARVASLPVRNKSILDIITKLGTSSAMVNRSVVKSVTSCGCIRICAEKQAADFFNPSRLSTHIEGELCPACSDAVKKAIGENLFYFALLCNTLNIELDDIFKAECDCLSTLGKFCLR